MSTPPPPGTAPDIPPAPGQPPQTPDWSAGTIRHSRSGYLPMIVGGSVLTCLVALMTASRGQGFHLLYVAFWWALYGWYQIPLLALVLAPAWSSHRHGGVGPCHVTNSLPFWGTCVMMGVASATRFMVDTHLMAEDSRDTFGTWAIIFRLLTILLLVTTVATGSVHASRASRALGHSDDVDELY